MGDPSKPPNLSHLPSTPSDTPSASTPMVDPNVDALLQPQINTLPTDTPPSSALQSNMEDHNKNTSLPHQPSTSSSTPPVISATNMTPLPPHLPPTNQLPPQNDDQNFPPLATPTPTVSQPHSWASLLKENRKIGNGMNLREINVDQHIGAQSVMYEFKEEQVLTLEDSWGICLIGFILGRFPGLKAFNEVRSSWGVSSKYQFHESGWMMFKFETEEDREQVLLNGPYSTFGIPWMLKKMPLFFQFQEECFTSVPTWIKLPRLPLQLFGEEALSVLASFVGKPIQTDQFTKAMNKPAYARVLVEVDATKPLMREITFKVPNGKVIHQEVVYEYEPQVCTKCHTLGHDQEKCKGPKKFQSRGRSKSRPRHGMVAIGNELDIQPETTMAITETIDTNTVTTVNPEKTTVNSSSQDILPPTTAVLNITTKTKQGQQLQNDEFTQNTAVKPPMTAVKQGQQAKTSKEVLLAINAVNKPLTEPNNNRKDNKGKGKEQLDYTSMPTTAIQISPHSPSHSQLKMSGTEPYPEEMALEEVQLRFAEVPKSNKPRAASEGDIQSPPSSSDEFVEEESEHPYEKGLGIGKMCMRDFIEDYRKRKKQKEEELRRLTLEEEKERKRALATQKKKEKNERRKQAKAQSAKEAESFTSFCNDMVSEEEKVTSMIAPNTQAPGGKSSKGVTGNKKTH